MKIQSMYKIWVLTIVGFTLSACSVFETTATQIDLDADEALKIFATDIDGSEIFLNQSAGYLVFPRALRAGLGVGAETGEGVLRIDGKTVDYFRITSGSLGLQAGAQARSIVICFMSENSLNDFRNSSGWRVCRWIYFQLLGVDGEPDTRGNEVYENQQVTLLDR
jgi:lipid-binding SYLF domain-containing protein